MIKILTLTLLLSMRFQKLLTFLTMQKKLTVYRICSIYDNHIYFLIEKADSMCIEVFCKNITF